MTDKLTDEENKQAREYFVKYQETQKVPKEMNQEIVIDSIYKLYEIFGYDKPFIFFCQNPAESHYLINLAKKTKSNFFRSMNDLIGNDTSYVYLYKLIGDLSFLDIIKNRQNYKEHNNQIVKTLVGYHEQLISSGDRLEFEYTWFRGHLDLYWICYYDFCRNVLNLEYKQEAIDKLELAKTLSNEVSYIHFYENHAFVTHRAPVVNIINDHTTLHNEDGPSIGWEDGFSLYHINGRRVPRYIVTNPELITLDEIHQNENIEVRDIMRRKYGLDRYLRETEAIIVNRDLDKLGNERILYRIEKEEYLFEDEPIQMVHVKNSTPEPDGTLKNYFLGVPPDIKTCLEGIAWTFDEPVEDYDPSVET